MRKELPVEQRDFVTEQLNCDLVVVGGGMAGTCGAITAARAGIRVVLIQDRPVLGGNASSEVRLWVLSATSHMGNNNRWAREGGVMDELYVENTYRNPEGNPVILDTILLEKVLQEKNITLLLNTAVLEVVKSNGDTIDAVRAFNSQNQTMYEVRAPLFCDASGDGVVGFLAGAAFRMGAEASAEFGEKFAPSKEYGELLGHTIFFFTKDTGKPVRFFPPSYALADITQIPRYRDFTPRIGGGLWWVEYGGRLDTVAETEKIKWELWRVVYGVWNYLKNSGKFPETETHTLDWVGLLPGKRESRRFEGDYMLRQQDLVEQRVHPDAVSYGGWAIDLHPADGVFSEKPACNQWHSRGVYQIPYRCLYSRNIKNLFLAGRIISASHVAFGATRVQATCANSAQAVGIAAAHCIQKKCLPADLVQPSNICDLQTALMRAGQHIPGLHLDDPDDLARRATISASSELRLAALSRGDAAVPLTSSWAQMLPVKSGRAPRVTFTANVAAPTDLLIELRTSNRPDNFTPDVLLGQKMVRLAAGERQPIVFDFNIAVDEPRYLFYCLRKNDHVAVMTSDARVTGILAVTQKENPLVSNLGAQVPPEDIGVESFEFWCPQRRPAGQNLAITLEPPLAVFAPQNVVNGIARPTNQPNAWVADFSDPAPTLTLRWDEPQTITRIELSFDTDFDHPMETVHWGHPERAMPFCIKHYRICDDAGRVVAEQTENHQTRNTIVFAQPVTTARLQIELVASHGAVPAALFAVRCYAA
jgi:hypothetical protein